MKAKFDITQWGYIKDKLRNKYPELTNADLFWGRVNKDDMLKMISTKLRKSKKDLMDEIESFEYSSSR
jgi:Ni2+-binding GTPase involved in maturation of urease and hydrogenase